MKVVVTGCTGNACTGNALLRRPGLALFPYPTGLGFQALPTSDAARFGSDGGIMRITDDTRG